MLTVENGFCESDFLYANSEITEGLGDMTGKQGGLF